MTGLDRSVELIPETAGDTERSVVISDHPFTNPEKPHLQCLLCGLAAATHAEVKDVYVSNAREVETCQDKDCDFRVASNGMTCAAGHVQVNAQVLDV